MPPLEEEEERKEKETVEPKAKSGPNIIVVIAALIIIQALVAFAVVMFAIPKEDKNSMEALAASLQNPETAQASTSSLGDISGEVVLPVKAEVIENIAGTNGERFLKAKIAFAYDKNNPANKDIEVNLAPLEVQLKYKVSEYLATLTLEQVSDGNIRKIISTNILSELNSIIPASVGRLSNVYVEEFIIQ